jgi:hypothetical protein
MLHAGERRRGLLLTGNAPVASFAILYSKYES